MKILVGGHVSQETGGLVTALEQAADDVEVTSSVVAGAAPDAVVVIVADADGAATPVDPSQWRPAALDAGVPIVAIVPSAAVGEAAIAAGVDDYLVRDHAPPAAILRAVRRAAHASERAAAAVAQQRHAALAELGRLLLVSRETTSFLDEACRVLHRAVAASSVALIEVDRHSGSKTIRAAAGPVLVPDPVADAAPHTELSYVARAVRPVVVPDYPAETRFAPASFIAPNCIRTGVCCPVIARGETAGILGVWAGSRESFTDADAVFVEAVANLMADFLVRERDERLQQRRESLLRMASRVGRIGGWVVDLVESEITWSDEVRIIHDVPHDFVATFENGLALYAEEFREPLARAVEECARTGEPFDIEVQSASSQRRWLRITGEAEYDHSGRIRGVRGASQDISACKLKEKQIREQTERLTAILEALIESERRFRTLAESLPQIVWMTTPKGEHLYTNPRWEEYVGAAAKNEYWTALVHPDDRDRVDQTWRRALATAQFCETELRLRCHDGTYRWMLARALPIRDDDGRVTQWLGTCTDVDDLREALDAARASEEERAALVAALLHEKRKLVDIFRQAPNFMAVARGPNHVFEYANEAYYTCIGRRDILGKPVVEALPELVGQQFLSLLDHVYSTGEPIMLHGTPIVLRRQPDREPELRYIDFVYHPLTEADGTVTGILAQGTDVTERHTAEARVREQAALIDEANDAIVVRDLDLRITFWSKGAERLYGWSARDAIGRNSEELLGLVKGTFAPIVETVRATGNAQAELRVMHAGGRAMTIDRRCTLLRDDEGRPSAILTFDTDVTERKRVEEHLLREQRVESIGRLASGVAHDLNNLLAPVLMGANLLRPLVIGDRAQQVIRLIEQSARRGGDLVERILSFARGADGERKPLHLGTIIDEVNGIMRSTLDSAIAIDVEADDDLHPVEGDRTQLHQLLLNLCLNARDAMSRGGRLTISATNVTMDDHRAALHGGLRSGRYVRLAVTDTGDGIAPDVIDEIFDPFFTTKEVGKGTGLGLTVAAAIVRRHHGTIAVQSVPQRGTTFEIHLPAAKDAERSHEAIPESAPAGAGELILVVDDEEPVLTVVTSTLVYAGYRVVAARNGADALAVFNTHQSEIAAVVTDLRMPVMDGAAFVAALKRMDARIPIIASTGGDAHGETREIASDVLLRKPYSAEVLLAAVRRLVSPAELGR